MYKSRTRYSPEPNIQPMHILPWALLHLHPVPNSKHWSPRTQPAPGVPGQVPLCCCGHPTGQAVWLRL